jgi:hypothetical protein
MPSPSQKGVGHVGKRWPGETYEPEATVASAGEHSPQQHGLTEELAAGCNFKLSFQQNRYRTAG